MRVKIQRKGCAQKQTEKIYRKYGDLVRMAVHISGRSKSMVYAVLSGRTTSEPVQRAIEEARERIERARKRAA